MRCSFCRRSDSDVAKLVASPLRIFAGRVYICDRCAAETIQIMEAHSGDDQPRGETQSLFGRTLNQLGWKRHRDAPSESECHAPARTRSAFDEAH
jgi:hypothetical protein